MLQGREDALRVVASLLAESRSVARIAVVVGAEGVGKTSLVETALEEHPGNVVRIDLIAGDADVGMFAVAELAACLGVDEPADGDIETALHEAIVAAGHLVVFIDNAHWTDAQSQRTLLHLIRSLRDAPVLLLVTTLPIDTRLYSRLRAMVRSPRRGVHIVLEPLGAGDLAALVKSRFGVRPSHATVSRVLEITGGYPAIVTALFELLDASADRNVARALAKLMLRPWCEGVLDDRLDEVLQKASPDARAGLLALALGGELAMDELASILARRGRDHVTMLELEQTGIVHRSASGGLRIRHGLLARATAERAGQDEVRAMHAAIGDVFVGTRALPHKVAAVGNGEDVARVLGDLGERYAEATRNFDFELAFSLAVLGAALDPENMVLAAMAAIRASRLDLLWPYERKVAAMAPSMARTALTVVFAIEQGRLHDAFSDLARIDLTRVGDFDTAVILAHSVESLASATYLAGQDELTPSIRSTQSMLTAMAAGSREESMRLECLAHVGLLEVWRRLVAVDREDYVRRIDVLMELADEMSSGPSSGFALAMLGAVKLAAGDLAGAREVMSGSTLDASWQLGLMRRVVLAHVHFLNCDWDEASSLADIYTAEVMDSMPSVFWRNAFGFASCVPWVRGDEEKARQLVAWQWPIDGSTRPASAAALGEVWGCVAEGGDQRLVATRLDSMWQHADADWVTAYTTVVLRVRAHLAVADREAALRALEESRRMRCIPLVHAYAEAHTRALLAAHDGDEAGARAHFVKAMEALVAHWKQGYGLRVYSAVLAEDWADFALAASTSPSQEVVDAVSGAAVMLREAGATDWATRLAERARELREQRERFVTRSSELLNPLTSREREVALLVREGLSNREIADKLVITIRTAEYHVHNSLTKLGCASRVELRELLLGEPVRRSPHLHLVTGPETLAGVRGLVR